LTDLEVAKAAIGDQPLAQQTIEKHLAPLFSKALKADRLEKRIYLATHSLGRPLDQTAHDLARAIELWTRKMDDCWSDEAWLGEIEHFRSAVGALLGLRRSDAVVPKSSAGQGLRAVLNAFPQPGPLNVVTTDAEFDSVDFILKVYESAGRAKITRVPSTKKEGPVPIHDPQAIIDRIRPGAHLVVVSAVFFTTGQVLPDLKVIVEKAHRVGARILVDVYHAVGVIPVDMTELDADFMIGGCYKYLRGGPGACYLAINPRILDSGEVKTTDTGWFAKKGLFEYSRDPKPEFAEGGNAWLESTPSAFTAYQARAGLDLTQAVSVDRIRAYQLQLLSTLRQELKAKDLPVFEPQNPDDFGAFALLPHPNAEEAAKALKRKGLTVDSRGGFLRLGPDLLTTGTDLYTAAEIVARR